MQATLCDPTHQSDEVFFQSHLRIATFLGSSYALNTFAKYMYHDVDDLTVVEFGSRRY